MIGQYPAILYEHACMRFSGVQDQKIVLVPAYGRYRTIIVPYSSPALVIRHQSSPETSDIRIHQQSVLPSLLRSFISDGYSLPLPST